VDLGADKASAPPIPDVHLVNNIFSTRGVSSTGFGVVGKVARNWLGGGCGISGTDNIRRADARMWPDEKQPVDFHLPDNANGRSAVDAGLDLAKPFVIDGKEFPPLPGARPFAGARPDIGALEVADRSGKASQHEPVGRAR
jgi:hypothetical protein